MPRLLALLLFVAAAPATAARLTGLAIAPGVVTVIADGPPAVAHQFALDAPYRLVIDIPGVVGAPLAATGTGSVTGLRAANFSPGVARLVIDLARPLEIVAARNSAIGLTLTLRRVSDADFARAVGRGRRPLPVLSGGPTTPPGPTLPPATAASTFALPADMFTGAAIGNPPAVPPPVTPPVTSPVTPPATAPLSAVAATPSGPLDPETATPSPVTVQPPPVERRPAPRPRSPKGPIVVIDAGHGGKDVGAISGNGGYEKDVTLAIAKATARIHKANGRVRVVLTRDDDRFIPLGGRVQIARGVRADLFVSIHADSAPNPDARGASVYTLSAVASDALAARLAARENKSDIIGGVNLGTLAPEVGDIMIDLSRRATGNVSVSFAETLQDSLSDRIKFRGEFHHFAGFYVLKAADVPSVLLETGYVTNADDSEILFSDTGRRRIAAGIALAIERHLLGN